MNEQFKIYTDEMAKELTEKISQFNIKSIESDKNGTFKVIASKQVMDRQGEIVEVNGIETNNFGKNPVILFGHDYWSLDAIIGKATKRYVQDDEFIIEGVFAPAEGNPKAQQARKLYDDGFINTVSIGFRVLQRAEADRRIIEKSELLECSFVPIPANQDALAQRGYNLTELKELGIMFTEEKKEVEEDKNEDDDKPMTKKEGKELKELLEKTLGEIKELKEVSKDSADDNANGLTDKEVKAKETLQSIDKVIGKALREFKVSK